MIIVQRNYVFIIEKFNHAMKVVIQILTCCCPWIHGLQRKSLLISHQLLSGFLANGHLPQDSHGHIYYLIIHESVSLRRPFVLNKMSSAGLFFLVFSTTCQIKRRKEFQKPIRFDVDVLLRNEMPWR